MSQQALETFLARLYTEEAFRRAFIADPHGAARRAGLDDAQALQMASMDPDSVELAAQSYARKRESRQRNR